MLHSMVQYAYYSEWRVTCLQSDMHVCETSSSGHICPPVIYNTISLSLSLSFLLFLSLSLTVTNTTPQSISHPITALLILRPFAVGKESPRRLHHYRGLNSAITSVTCQLQEGGEDLSLLQSRAYRS